MGAPATADPPADLEKKRQEQAAAGEPEPEPQADPPAGDPPADPPAAQHEGEPLEGEGDEEGPPPIAFEGSGQLNLKVGGRKPDKGTVKMRGGSIELPKGQLEKGEIVDLYIRVQCAEVHVVDKIDNSTGEIVGTERRHIVKVKGVERLPDKS